MVPFLRFWAILIFMENLLSAAEKIHFVGIGGTGISAVARMMLLQGKMISGSDRSESPTAEELAKLGAKIFIGQNAENISKDTNLVIYTVAIPDDNPELLRAKELKIKCVTYPQALNIISADKYTVAISGTHGKTTTTAMVGKILLDAGADPTVVVGSSFKDLKTNMVAGKGDLLVVEADEYRRGFLNLSPKILVIANIDEDHLDYYKNLEDIQSAFSELAEKIPKDGFLICDKNDEHLLPVLKSVKSKVVDYPKVSVEGLNLKFPGKHNVKNAQCALAVAEVLGLDFKKAVLSLNDFAGTERRFEFKGKTESGALVYDDYAHNPHKLRAVLSGARELFPNKKIVAVFQPHLYSRTKTQLDEFAKSFQDADMVLLPPIYPAREKFDPSISSEMLVEKIADNYGGVKALAFESLDSIFDYLKKNLAGGEVVITIGAGDVTSLSDRLVQITGGSV